MLACRAPSSPLLVRFFRFNGRHFILRCCFIGIYAKAGLLASVPSQQLLFFPTHLDLQLNPPQVHQPQPEGTILILDLSLV